MIKQLLETRLVKVAGYLIASGFLTEVLDSVVQSLSEIDLPEKSAMLVINLLLVLAIYGRKAIKA